jgi:hypothetical protein
MGREVEDGDVGRVLPCKAHDAHGVVGRIVNVKAEESVLNDEGKVDVQKLNVLMFDNYCHGYYSLGEKEGQAWNAGMDLMK